MAKFLFSLFILTVVFGIPGCKINDSADLNESIPGVETPEADAPLNGGEMLTGIPSSPADGRIQLAVDKDNILWINCFKAITAYYDNKFQIFDQYNTNLPHAFLYLIFVDNQNRKWFGTYFGEVFMYDNKIWTVFPTPTNTYYIYSFTQDNDGNIWVAGEQENKYILWSYRNGQIDKVIYCNGLQRPANLAVDSKNNIWGIADSGGLYKINAVKRDDLQNFSVDASVNDTLNNSSINDIFYNKRNDMLYISTGRGYRNICEAGIYSYNGNNFEALATEKTGLPAREMDVMLLDGKGNLWSGYWSGSDAYPDLTLGTFKDGRWVNFEEVSSIRNFKIKGVTSDNNGLIWLIGRDLSSEQIDLVTFDGDKWSMTILPTLFKDPRFFWREEELAELFKYPASRLNAEEVLNNPRAFRGKKISFIGNSGFEPANLNDETVTNLNMKPVYHDELPRLLTETGLRKEIDNSVLQEYIGYLEYTGSYGHPGEWEFQLFITEIYPYLIDSNQKAHYQKLYETYANALAQDKKEIKLVVDQWISARGSGNIEELKKIYPPDSGFYEYALTEKGQEDIKNNTMYVTINNFSLRVENLDAEVSIHSATVKPQKYAEPHSGGIGIYKLHSINLHKYGTAWKITEIFYAPNPAPVPLPTPPSTSE